MPGRKRFRTETGLRPSRIGRLRKQQTRRRNALVRVPRSKIGYPQSMQTKLRYCTRYEFIPTSTTVLSASFLANGMFDPEVGIGGHQPRGFDEFMQTYKTFMVKGSKISTHFCYEGYNGPTKVSSTGNLIQSIETGMTDQTAAVSPVICGMQKSVDALGAGTGEVQIEKDRSTWGYFNPSTAGKTLSTSCKVSDFYGKGALTGSEGYTGSATADPTEQVLYHIWCGRVSDDYPDGNCKVVAYVTIEYDAVFTEPKTLNAS